MEMWQHLRDVSQALPLYCIVGEREVLEERAAAQCYAQAAHLRVCQTGRTQVEPSKQQGVEAMGDRLLHGGCTVAPAVRQRENEWALEVAKTQDLRIDKSVRERKHLGGWNSIGASYAEELAANHPARKLPPSNRMFTSGPPSVCGVLPIHS
ncbi:MAG: hypothetical protein ACPIOQ_49760, partial [Promethearchaeia archaeon]